MMRVWLWASVVCLAASCGDGASTPIDNPLTDPESGPPAGNPEGTCEVPDEARPADVSSPDSVVGDGSPESCTSKAVVDAVARGGVITFDCGPDPITITMEETAKVFNDTGPEIVIDGGGLVTLSGAGARRILYMNTCDEDQVWTTSHCQDQDHPRLTVQNLTFVDGNSSGLTEQEVPFIVNRVIDLPGAPELRNFDAFFYATTAAAL